jgi:hypothetical protein
LAIKPIYWDLIEKTKALMKKQVDDMSQIKIVINNEGKKEPMKE